jgi:hypothetical protein
MANAKSPTPKVHHFVRTFVASVLGSLALILISASIFIVWANRTLTDTTAFTQAVGPVLQQSPVQEFVAKKVTTQLLDSAPTADLAAQLLPPEQAAGKSPDQLRMALQPVIHDSLVDVLKAPQVQEAWRKSLMAGHAKLVSALESNSTDVTLDFGPLVDSALDEIKQTKLAPVATKIDLKPSAAVVTLKSEPLDKIHKAYQLLKSLTPIVVVLALVLVALSVWASVHHGKTLRRILTFTGVIALFLAAVVAVSASGVVVPPGGGPDTLRVAMAVEGSLLHGLEMECLVLGLVCLALALGYMLYDRSRGKTARR